MATIAGLLDAIAQCRISQRFDRRALIWADGGYAGKLIEWVKDYEQLPENSEAMILLSMINFMSKRLIEKNHHGSFRTRFKRYGAEKDTYGKTDTII